MWKDLHSIGQDTVVSVYTDKQDTKHFAAGFIPYADETHVLIAHIAPSGLYDGFIAMKIGSIVRLDYGGTYEKKIGALYRLRGQKHETVTVRDGSLIQSMLAFAKARAYVVTLELLDSGEDDLQGYVQALEDETVNIRLIGSYGEEDGNALIREADITGLVCNSEDEYILKLLRENAPPDGFPPAGV
ncbi:MAG TPA: hypothetical protein PKE04_18865 [Clostridia bacterium]|nr:hypothetical protein [Clostridia bacterium]